MVIRSSYKTFALGVIFLVGYFVADSLAERLYRQTTTGDFGVDFVRSWNPWDYVAMITIVFAFALGLASIWLFKKGD